MRNRAILFTLGVISIVLIVLTTLVPLIDPTLQTLLLIVGIVLNLIIILLFVFVRDKTAVQPKTLVEPRTAAGVVPDSKTRYKFEVYEDRSAEFRFRLVAPNGEIVAQGEGYSSKAGCLDGIGNIKENALYARIEDETKND